MKLSILPPLAALLLPASLLADGSEDVPHLHMSVQRNGLAREARLTWDGAGTLQQSFDMRRWSDVNAGTSRLSFTGGRGRSQTVDLGTGAIGSRYFRLVLPEPADDEHTHVLTENLFPYVPGQLAEVPDPAWTLARRLPVHRIRIHAIRTADTSGAYAATVSAAEITELVNQSNTIFYRAGVEFVFDPATDLQDIRDSTMNRDAIPEGVDSAYTNPNANPTALGDTDTEPVKLARYTEAQRHRGKLVVFFRWQKDGWTWNGTHWTPRATGSGDSSWSRNYVRMPPDNIGINHLAHELGHYLQNMHTFAGDYSKAEAEHRMAAAIANGSVTEDNALEVLNGDAFWVRDTPPDPGQSAFPGDGCSNPTLDLSVDTDPGPAVSLRTYTAAPDRLNLMSYFGDCTQLGLRRLSPDMTDRLRDGLENSTRHPLISQHISGFFLPNTTTGDTLNAAAISPGIKLLRTRWDQFAAIHRTAAGTVRLAAYSIDENGSITAQDSLSTGSTAEFFDAVNMGLGLVAVGLSSYTSNTQYRMYRLSDTGEWTYISVLATDAIAGPVTLARFGRLNIAAGHDGIGDLGAVVRLLETDANGFLRLQDEQNQRPGSSLSLGAVQGNRLIIAMRNADGTLSLESDGMSGERGANELVPISGALAGSVTSVKLVAHDYDRFTTVVRTTGGASKLIQWTVDNAGVITRLANGTDGPANEFLTATAAGSDIVATVMRTPANLLSLRLWKTNDDGTYEDLITNGAELQSADAFDSPAIQLVRDRWLAVARRTAAGNLQLRSYKFTP